jgi:hypothetical protein
VKILKLADQRDIRLAQAFAAQFARQCGLAASNEVVDQLVDQLRAHREEREATIAKLKAHFDAELAVLREELEKTRAEYLQTRAAYVQLKTLAECELNQRARVQ